MNTSHTPGPWHMGFGNGDGLIFPEYGRTRMEAGGITLYPVAQVNRGWDDNEDAANARLIVCAPELLDALQALIGEADLGEIDHDEETQALLKNARAAIAKATGAA